MQEKPSQGSLSLEKIAIKKTPFLIFYIRCLRLILHVVVGLTISALIFPWLKKIRKNALIQWWSTCLLNIFNIQMRAYGHIPTLHALLLESQTGTLFVANHISWVDIHALMSIIPLRFIAKSDIRSWPVFGYLCSKANVLFIERGKRHDAGKIVSTVHDSLIAGDHLCYFPEGTTTDGTHMLPFKGSLIQAAIDAKSTIQPVAIFYPINKHYANIDMAYAGETTLLGSMVTILKQAAPIIELNFFPPLNIAALDKNMQNRHHLSQAAHALIHQHLYKR